MVSAAIEPFDSIIGAATSGDQASKLFPSFFCPLVRITRKEGDRVPCLRSQSLVEAFTMVYDLRLVQQGFGIEQLGV